MKELKIPVYEPIIGKEEIAFVVNVLQLARL